MRRIPIAVCIDVEPDARSAGPGFGRDWDGFEETDELLRRLRRRCEAATGTPARVSWFLRIDPQIAEVCGAASWVVSRYGERIRRLRALGDELGLHVHPYRRDEDSGVWVEDFDDPRWVDHCVRLGFADFERSIGVPCRSFRFGDRWMSDATVGLLDALGARFDLTIEPGQNGGQLPERFTGRLPDYRGVPRAPYHPSRADFGKPGGHDGRDIWMIPVSTGSVHAPALAVERRLATTTWSIARGGRVATGVITADPNPIPVAGHGEGGSTRLSWTSSGTTEVEVRVGAPDGALFARTGPEGTAMTGSWVQNGDVCYLQDVSGGRPPTADNTLATVRIGVAPCEPGGPGAEDTCLTLNLAFDSRLVCRIAETLLTTGDRPHLVLVVRSDVGIRPDHRSNLEETFDYLLSHPLRDRFVLETPPGLIRLVHATR